MKIEHLKLWRQSFNIRRLCIRELPIDEILNRFPGYHRPELVRLIDQNMIRKIFI
jgi:hypothetical protein